MNNEAPNETKRAFQYPERGLRAMSLQSKAAIFSILLGLTLASATFSLGSAQLYDNVAVLGQLSCKTNVDIRTQIGASHRLRCTFTAAGNRPDILRRYFGVVLSLEEGNPAGEAKTLSWTVLHLKDPARRMMESEPRILGSYSHAPSSISAKYGLNSDTLIGGADKNVALEPRSTGSKNAAYAVTLFGLSN